MESPRSRNAPLLTTGNVASEVSHLFRTKRVSQIRALETQIRHEAAEKSDSLRHLLSTRYKDLLEAADRLCSMHEAATVSVHDNLCNTTQAATSLRTHFLEKAAPPPVSSAHDLERRRAVHILSAKLKHIVDSPEVLYACLEEGQIYDAAVRFAHAARNFAQIRDTAGLEGVANRFAERRWQQVQAFKPQILTAAEGKLITPHLTSRIYARVFSAIIILSDDSPDIIAILDTMLASRTAWIYDNNQQEVQNVAASMRRIADTVRDTVTCLADMFWREDSGVEPLLREVDEVAADNVATLRKDGELNGACVRWTNAVKDWMGEHAMHILEVATTSRSLADALCAVDEAIGDESWAHDCQAVLMKPPGFVFDIFKPFISERASIVAGQCISRAVDKVLSDMEEVWEDIKVGPHAGKILWSTVSSQAVGFLGKAKDPPGKTLVDKDVSSSEEADLADILAGNEQVASVVGIFETSLQEALSDVTMLIQRIPSVSESFDKSVRSCLPRILKSLRDRLDSIPQVVSDMSASQYESYDNQMERALFIARTATALGNASCVESAYIFSIENDAAIEGENTTLENFRKKSDDLSCSGYGTWASRLCVQLKKQLTSDLTSGESLRVPTGWSSEETGNRGVEDSDNNITESLLYPTTASAALVNFLMGACNAANGAGGFALPYHAIQCLREEMIESFIAAYKEAHCLYKQNSKNELSGGSSDTAIMQMLFDILVLQKSFEPVMVMMKPKAIEGLKLLESTIQASVDPIDLSSCRKALGDSVFAYISRTYILFGTITRSNTRKSLFSRRPSIASNLSTSSNLVTMSRAVPRFTYLPAPMPSTYTSAGVGTAGLNAKAAIGLLRTEASIDSGSSYRKREVDTTVAEYVSKVSESVGHFGRGFFESLTRKVG